MAAVKLPVEIEHGTTSNREGVQTDVAREKRARQPGGLQRLSVGYDATLAVTLREWDRDGRERKWGVAVLLRLSPPQRGDHKRRISLLAR